MDPSLTIFNGSLYEKIDTPLWGGWSKFRQPVAAVCPTIQWRGKRIPWELYLQIIAFFRFVYNRDKDECQIKLFYHEEHGWAADALPQRGIGMTTKEIEDHPLRNTIMEKWMSLGYSVCGTGHHHCSAPAFQSGTDANDEVDTIGVHFTIGNVDKKTISTHCRLTFMRQCYSAELCDYIDYPPLAMQTDDISLRDAILRHLVLNPPDWNFPGEWLESIIKTSPVTTSYGNTSSPHGFHVSKYQGTFPQYHGETPQSLLADMVKWPFRAKSVMDALTDITEFVKKHSASAIDDALKLHRAGIGPDEVEMAMTTSGPATPVTSVAETYEEYHNSD